MQNAPGIMHLPSANSPAGAFTCAGTSGARAPRILVAEDDDALRALLAAALREDGHRVEEARSGLEALGLLRGARVAGRDGERAPRAEADDEPDLIVVDVRMPGVSGLEVLREALAAQAARPVLVMSAFCDEELRARALRLGARAVLAKPFDVDDFRATVAASLR